MDSRVPRLFLGLLACLVVATQAPAAPAQRFATGFLIYKNVRGDVPEYYNGLLYISAAPPVALWTEYDIGQPKPFRIETALVVREIKFGTLFSADFTTEKHVDYCRGIQAQLAEAAAQSPKLKNAVQALSKSIQTEIDHYDKLQVRYQGQWISRSSYHETIYAQEKKHLDWLAAQEAEKAAGEARVAAHNERVRREEAAARAAKEAQETDERMRRENLAAAYPSAAARYLTRSFDDFRQEAIALARAGRVLTGTLPSHATATAYPLPRDATISTELRTNLQGSENEVAVLCAFDAQARLVCLNLGFYIIADSTKEKLLNVPELELVRGLLTQVNAKMYDALPELLAVAKIYRVTRPLPRDTMLTPFTLNYSYLTTEFGFGVQRTYLGDKYRQFVSVRVRPPAT